MNIVTQRLWIGNDVDYQTMTAEQVRLATVIQLPFRIRCPSVTRIRLNGDDAREVCLRNDVSVLPGTSVLEVAQQLKGDYESLRTHALVVKEKPKLEPMELELLRKGPEVEGVKGQDSTLDLSRFAPDYVGPINRVIIGCAHVQPDLFAVTSPRLMDIMDVLNGVVAEIVLAVPPEYILSDEEINDIFKCRADKKIVMKGRLSSNVDDVRDMDVAAIERCTSFHEEFIGMEFAFQARAFMARRQFTMALLMAMVALEAAHATLLRYRVGQKLPGDDKSKSGTLNDLLREQGFHTLIRVSPYLVMDEEERPDETALEACLNGIQIRNAAMHALTKKGGYRIRQYSEHDILEAYEGVVSVYQCFVRAVEGERANSSTDE